MIGLLRRLIGVATAPYIGCLSNAEIDARLRVLEARINDAGAELEDVRCMVDELYVGSPVVRVPGGDDA
jgi:hypothetical protein